MVADNRSWQRLEFDKILQQLAKETSFSLGRVLVEQLTQAPDEKTATEWLAETDEAREILRLYPMFRLGGVRDIGEGLRRAELGGVLSVSELVEVGDTCRAIRQTKEFFSQLRGSYPICAGLAKLLGLYKTIESALEKAITPEGAIADTASDQLYSLRKRIRQNQDRIKDRLESFIHNPNSSKYLQDPLVTMRGGRYVVPVKQEYRAQVPGMVHDMSASGATVFVEPMGVMEANNELSQLHMAEEEEIAAILHALTLMVAGFVADIRLSLELMAKLDFLFAKGRLSEKMDGVAPKINETGSLYLKRARHPLVAGKVVPVDIRMNSRLYALVITGPNTGGKTVSLKTVGLLTLMALCGLHIPAEKGSEVAYYQNIFADIGDEQSIEQSLSTFSSHLVNIVKIVQEADENSLVLLDELGAGTDPTEGAALAMAILEYLYGLRAKVVATTHYSELKSFAYKQEGFSNASVEFDVATLRPTYRLLMGVPGKSNAFEISRRLGMQEGILQRAADLLTPDQARVADMITSLEQERRQAAEELEQARLLRQQQQELADQLGKREVALENRAGDLLRQAQAESLKIVQKTKEQAEMLYAEMQGEIAQAAKNAHGVQTSRRKIKELENQLREKAPEQRYDGKAPATVQPGDMVEIPKLRQTGQVLTVPNRSDEVLVQIGVMKVTLKVGDLRADTAFDQKTAERRNQQMRLEKTRDISPEVDLRGLMVEEAMEKLDKYLDDAFIAGLKEVRVIHGKGTGALRQGLQPYFKKHRLIKTATLAGYYEGGAGVTVLELDL